MSCRDCIYYYAPTKVCKWYHAPIYPIEPDDDQFCTHFEEATE